MSTIAPGAIDPAAVDVVRQATGRAIARAAIERAREWRRRGWTYAPPTDQVPIGPPGEAARAWLSRAIGVPFDTAPCRQLGVSAARVELFQDGTFGWLERARTEDDLAGTRAVLIPVPGDVVAIDPAQPERAWTLRGEREPLGWQDAEIALRTEAPAIVVARDALAWLRLVVRDGTGEPGVQARHACHAMLDDMPAVAVLDWQGPEASALLGHQAAILVAADEAGAAALHRRAKAWRRAHMPPSPRIGVWAPPAPEAA